MMLLLVFLSQLVAVLGQGTQSPYIGCYSEPIDNGLIDQYSLATSLTDCIDYCSNNVQAAGSTMAQYSLGAGFPCGCYAPTGPGSQPGILGGASYNFMSGTCGSSSSNYVTFTLLNTFENIYENIVPSYTGCSTYNSPLDGTATSQETVRDCQISCRTFLYLAYTISPVDPNTVTCTCLNTIPLLDNNAVCSDPNTAFFQSHSAEDAAASLYRRARDRREKARKAKRTFCPLGLSACTIPGTSEYECIDTNSELESCGGCMFGSFDNATATPGRDCSRGAQSGAATCVAGSCMINSCRRGMKLVDGRCV